MRAGPAIGALAALALGLGLGFAAARRPAPGGAPAAPGEAALAEDLASIDSLRRALDDPDWLTRSYRFTGFLLHLAPENLAEALDVIEPQLPWLVTDEYRAFMLAWSRFDAPGALAHALAWPAQFRRNGSGAALYAWAFRDPEGALGALEGVEDRELREFMEGRLIAGWAHGEHRGELAEHLAAMPEGPRRFTFIGTLAWELARQSPEQAKRWAEGISDFSGRYKAGVFLQVATALAADDPPGTAAWLRDHLDRPYAEGTLRVVSRSWATEDPVAALEWLASLPAGEARGASIGNAFAVWHDRAPEEAESWLRAHTPERTFDPAVRIAIDRSDARAPAEALAWAQRIEDAQRREWLLRYLERRRARSRPPAAPEATPAPQPAS